MPLPLSLIGRSTAPVTHELDAEWLASFANSVGDRSPNHVDVDRAGELVAHPLFPVCVEWPAVTAAARLDDAALRADERRRGIHTTHDLTIHRLLRPDDVVTTTATVAALEPRPRGTLERLRLETYDAAGALVATTVMGLLFLGVAIDGVATPTTHGISGAPEAAADDLMVTGAAPVSTVELPVAAEQARAYSEGSRIWNPIHTEAAAAAAAGLPAPILHGTCTLAMAMSAAFSWAGVAAPDAPRRVRARFVGMVRMPSTLELRVTQPSARAIHFDVFDAQGAAVLRDGRLTL